MSDQICRLCNRPIGQHSMDTADICNTFLAEGPDDVVGHKTFDTGELCTETGFPKLRHEPLTRAEANSIWESAVAAKNERAERMPDEQAAIRSLWDAYQRLKELGWNDPSYCPKDGSHFKVIEPGSTGIHDCNYQGEWPTGSWWLYDGDVWPSRPVLFKRYPEDQEKYDQKMREAGARVRAWMDVGCPIDDED